jgi:hypothetical protein
MKYSNYKTRWKKTLQNWGHLTNSSIKLHIYIYIYTIRMWKRENWGLHSSGMLHGTGYQCFGTILSIASSRVKKSLSHSFGLPGPWTWNTYVTNMLSQNFCNKLPTNTMQCPRRRKISTIMRQKPKIWKTVLAQLRYQWQAYVMMLWLLYQHGYSEKLNIYIYIYIYVCVCVCVCVSVCLCVCVCASAQERERERPFSRSLA